MGFDHGVTPAVRLRPATPADWPLIRRWLARAEIEQWWGPKASSEAAVLMAMSCPHAICRMIEVGARPHDASDSGSAGSGDEAGGFEAVGYGQALDAMLWGEDLPAGIEPGTWDIDLFVASPDHRNRGIGPCALGLLRDEVFSTTLAVAVCVFAALVNERAVRAYETAGFRWKGVWTDPAAGPSWFMIAERPEG